MLLILIALVVIFFVMFLATPQKTKKVTKKKGPGEVFCIGKNKYRYVAAQDVCRELGGRLATVEELHEAYKNGADWCTLGWCQGQKAYYPSQRGAPGCRPGFRGGPMPGQLKLGAVCYGRKPKKVLAKEYSILPWNSQHWKEP